MLGAHKELRDGLAGRGCSARVRMCRMCTVGSHMVSPAITSQRALLPSAHHKELFSPWEPSSEVSQSIINIQQRETIRLLRQEDRIQLASYN